MMLHASNHKYTHPTPLSMIHRSSTTLRQNHNTKGKARIRHLRFPILTYTCRRLLRKYGQQLARFISHHVLSSCFLLRLVPHQRQWVSPSTSLDRCIPLFDPYWIIYIPDAWNSFSVLSFAVLPSFQSRLDR